MKKNIAVMTGGDAAEAGISLKSAQVVYENLSKEKYNPYKIVITGNDWILETQDGTTILIDKNDFSFTQNGTKTKFDAVFMAIHGTPAEDGKLQGYLDLMGIPYNCCGVLQAALTFDKSKTKEYLSPFGILSAKALSGSIKENRTELIANVNAQLQYPLFVKPNQNGSSYGASKVSTADELAAAIDLGFQYDTEILIEEFIAGTEVTCGVLTYQGKVTAMPITEIRSKSSFFDYKAKYEGDSQEITPAEIDETIAKEIQKTAVFIYQKLAFKGMCRIDFIIRENQFYMLEVNSIPGISPASIFPQQAKVFGLSIGELFDCTIEECLKK